jgi:3-methylcrotonyl-CoA carboxylase beta subunit
MMSLLRTTGFHVRGLRLRKTPALRALIVTHTHRLAETALSQVKTNVDTSSSDFKSNAEAMSELTSSLRRLHENIKLGGPEKARQKHLARKKMLPRE